MLPWVVRIESSSLDPEHWTPSVRSPPPNLHLVSKNETIFQIYQFSPAYWLFDYFLVCNTKRIVSIIVHKENYIRQVIFCLRNLKPGRKKENQVQRSSKEYYNSIYYYEWCIYVKMKTVKTTRLYHNIVRKYLPRERAEGLFL